jgi:hypothetical protein
VARELSDNRPLTIKAALRQAGLPLSGSVRAAMSRQIDDALFSLWENACAMYDAETAAVILFSVVCNDPSFRMPHWLILRLKAHKAAIINAVDDGSIKHAQQGQETW